MTMNRRELLKGMSLGAGSLVLSPILSRLHAQASGNPAAARRFVFVLEANGVPPHQLAPSGIARKQRYREQGAEKFFEASLADRELPVSLKPVAEFKDRITILQGLSGRISGGGHSNHFGALGCFPGRDNASSILGETIDAALAKIAPGVFPHVGLGLAHHSEQNVAYNLSAWSAGKPLPTLCKPDRAYAALFGSVAGRQDFAAKSNLLDFLKDDLKAAQSRLALPEREQLGAYVETLETLRRRQTRLQEIEPTLRKQGPVLNDQYTSTVETERLEAHFDLGTAALICGLTNVLTISSGCGSLGYITYKGLGIPIDGHAVGHGGTVPGMSSEDIFNAIRAFHFKQIAKLARRLREIKEGDGTMLDSTVIVYLSDAAENHHSAAFEWPMVILGNAGGQLKTGRYLDYPAYGRKGHRRTANLFVTLLRLAGANRDEFGMPDPDLGDLDQKGPLTELLS
jgi:hypothetical protein